MSKSCPHCGQPIETEEQDRTVGVRCSSCNKLCDFASTVAVVSENQDSKVDETANWTTNRADPIAANPRQIDRYRIDRLLGTGGFGRVYLAYDSSLERSVAVKVPHPELVSRQENADVYLAEARTVAILDHPNIVPVHDVGGTEDFSCYIVSKYVDGTNLATTIRKQQLSIVEAVELVATIADALHYAHTRGVVHRDVKPGNILIDAKGKPFIADFGLALRDHDIGTGPHYAGTPAYMSPEQARGEGNRVDGRSDIYSIGAVLYELLTGRRVHLGATKHEILEHLASREPKPPRQIDDTIPKELERICLKSLSKRASERYTTAKDLAEDLRLFLHEQTDGLGSQTTAEGAAALGGTERTRDSEQTPPAGWQFKSRKPIVGTAVLGMALSVFFALWAGGIIFDVEPKNGMLVVKVSDGGSATSVQGKTVTVRNVETSEMHAIPLDTPALRIPLLPGEYEFLVNAESEFQAKPDRFLIASGKEREVEVWREPASGRTPTSSAIQGRSEPEESTAGHEEALGTDIYRKSLNSTVWILAKSAGATVSGTGVLIDKDRKLIVTNFHVVGDSRAVVIFFPEFNDDTLVVDRRHYLKNVRLLGRRGAVLFTDQRRDLALIQLENLPENAEALEMADDSAKPGSRVHSIGNPGSTEALWVYTSGTVRAVYQKKFRTGAGEHEFKVVETQSPINSGDSGGPVINSQGKLIAISQAILPKARLVSYSVDVTELKEFMDRPLKSRPLPTADILAQAELQYTEHEKGHLQVDFSLGKEETQTVWISNDIEFFQRADVRRIWSLAVATKEAPKIETMLKLLNQNSRTKVGGWTLQKSDPDEYLLLYVVKIDALASPRVVKSTMDYVAKLAGLMKKDLATSPELSPNATDSADVQKLLASPRNSAPPRAEDFLDRAELEYEDVDAFPVEVPNYLGALNSTVWMIAKKEDGATTSGAGVLVDLERKLVITNLHVVSNSGNVVIFFPEFSDGTPNVDRLHYLKNVKRLGIRGRVVSVDRQRGLSLIEAEKRPANAVAIELSPKSIEPGSKVFSIGNSMSAEGRWVYTSATVTAVHPKRVNSATAEPGYHAVETEYAIKSDDNSGAPLMNDKGQLVAILQTTTPKEGLLAYSNVSAVKEFLSSPLHMPPRRVEDTLDHAELAYKKLESGALQVDIDLQDDESQSVFISNEIEYHEQAEFRRVWSPALAYDHPPKNDTVRNLLAQNSRTKMGAWTVQQAKQHEYSISYVVKMDAAAHPETVKSIMNYVANIASMARKDLASMLENEGITSENLEEADRASPGQ